MTIRTNHPEWWAERDAQDDQPGKPVRLSKDADEWARSIAARDEAAPVADWRAILGLGDTPPPARPAATGYFPDLSKLTPEHLADHHAVDDIWEDE